MLDEPLSSLPVLHSNPRSPMKLATPALDGLDWLGHLAAWPERLRSWLEAQKKTSPWPSHRLPQTEEEPDFEDETANSYHRSVMAEEVRHFLAPAPGKLYL